MKFIPSFGEISAKSKHAFKRFPITISWAIVGTLFAIFALENDSFDQLYTGKVLFTFVLGISWLISTRFFEEQFKEDKEWFMLLPIVFLLVFFWHLPSEGKEFSSTYLLRFALYLIAGHLLILVAPFILQWNKSAYFNYLKEVFISIVRSLFFSLILYLGIVLALLAIKYLFNVDIDGKRFGQIFFICLGIVNTWIYLSDFPKKIHKQTTVNYTKPLEVLVKYILIPLVILYLIILYAYSLKIIINWNLPKGWVSYLVIALSFLGFVIQMLINPIQKTIDSRPIRKFYPWFYILLLPLILLLFVAIFRRIGEYGVTENRYFVLAIAIWILCMTLYMLISKHKKIRTFPFTLALLILFISVGFWGAFNVSTKSQVQQFTKVFNEVKSNDFLTTSKKKNQLRSIVKYLSNKDDLDKISSVLGYNPEETFSKENRWNIPYKIVDSLNIKIKDPENDKNLYSNNYRYYTLNTYHHTLSVREYDYFKQIDFYNVRKTKNNSLKNYKFFLNSSSNSIIISNEFKKEKQVISIESLLKNLKENVQKNGNVDDVELLTIRKSYQNFNIKIVFTNIGTREFDEKKNRISNANGYVFIKEK